VNKLIVESKNDKYFIERLIKHLNIKNIEVDEPICNIDEYRCLDGIGELKKALYEIKDGDADKIGIILDADEVGVKKRLEQINEILKNLNINIKFTKNNELIHDKNNDIKIACHILNIGGKGELENILYEIKTSDSIFPTA